MSRVIVLTSDPGEVEGKPYIDEPTCPECERGRLIREPASEYDVTKLTCTAYRGSAGENCGAVFQLEPEVK